MRLMQLVVVVLIALLSPLQADEVRQLQEKNEILRTALIAAAQEAQELRQSNPLLNETSVRVIDSYHESWVDFYHHEKQLREHARDILFWQMIAAYVILALVVAVTGLGVYLSYVEVKSALKAPNELVGQMGKSEQELAPTATELVISLQKLQVTSAITGIVILVISLAFLYLFVDRVFELDPRELTAVHSRPLADGQK